jgi:hypothetical protein
MSPCRWPALRSNATSSPWSPPELGQKRYVPVSFLSPFLCLWRRPRGRITHKTRRIRSACLRSPLCRRALKHSVATSLRWDEKLAASPFPRAAEH